MKIIDIENWQRKRHHNFFKDFDYPHFNICANIDITKALNYCKTNDISFFKATLYSVMKTLNEMENFKYRIRGEKVVLHDIVHAAFTIMGENNLYSNCTADYNSNFQEFYENVSSIIDYTKQSPTLAEACLDRDDYAYLSCLPWLSFTSISHPIHISPADSVPRITWGKYFYENEKIKLPLSVQAHHSLMDGFHVSKFFSELENNLNNFYRD